MFWKGELKMRDKIIKSKMKVAFIPILPDNETLEAVNE